MSSPSISTPIQVWRDPRAVALLLAASLTTMANATISPALPGLERLFADDPNASLLVRLLVPAPSLGVAVCAPLVGLVADRYGRRQLLLSGVFLFVIAGSAGLLLPDLASIFASRLLLGVAVALIMTAQTGTGRRDRPRARYPVRLRRAVSCAYCGLPDEAVRQSRATSP